VHPKTGKVCVPIDPDAAWEFDPDDVPTVQQLLQEINEQQQQQDGGASPQQQVGTSVFGNALASI
jgi:DNA primase small subunit